MKGLLKYWRKFFTVVCLAVAAMLVIFGVVAADTASSRQNTTLSVTPANATTEISQQVTLEQNFVAEPGSISKLSVMLGDCGRANAGEVVFSICNQDGTEIYRRFAFDASEVKGDMFVTWALEEPLPVEKGTTYTLRVEGPGSAEGQSVVVLYGNAFDIGKYTLNTITDNHFWVNGERIDGSVCCEITYSEKLFDTASFWYFAAAVEILLVLYFLFLCWKQKHDRWSPLLNLMQDVYKARFLIKQLVRRDFKSKYQRSVLGVFWSLLNPLLTMAVQYMIFATLFQSTIEQFAVYLMIGIVIWNFFGETTGQGLSAITGNFSLITKVYVPKYVFPLSKVMCTSINLLISLLPLLVFILLARLPITPAYLLLPFAFLTLIMFCYGMALLLSTLMVFFRDTQFLWSVLSLLWMYLTPIFYPDSIIPQQFLTLFRGNPLYQYITFIRTVVIGGASPDLTIYIGCIAWGVGAMILGLIVFKRNEDKFVFYM